VPLLPDYQAEPAETLSIVLSTPTGASLGGTTSATLTIADNDPAGTISLPADEVVAPSSQSLELTLERTDGRSEGASVVCETTDGGTAIPGVDYTPVSRTVSFQRDGTKATCSLFLPSASDEEVTVKTVRVALRDPSFGVTLGRATTVVYLLRPE
jgi:hypothetical protein